MVYYEMPVDSTIADVAGQMVSLAKQLRAPVGTQVWGIDLIVHPGDTKRKVKWRIKTDLGTRCTR